MKNVLILHGFESNSQEHWFLNVKKELEKKGYKVHVPNMPNSLHPKQIEWVDIINKFKPDEKWILVGHSLGGTAILRYLETTKKPIGKAVFIATPLTFVGLDKIKDFFKTDFTWQNIKSNLQQSTILVSKDDKHTVILDHAKILSDKLNEKLIIKNGYGHGFDNAPIKMLVDMIK